MCFESLEYAEQFKHSLIEKYKKYEKIIIEVKPMSEVKRGLQIHDVANPCLRGMLGADIDDFLDVFYHNNDPRRRPVEAQKGTVFLDVKD